MEIYSTTLWHLQKDVALSALSKDLTDMDKNCPEVRTHLHKWPEFVEMLKDIGRHSVQAGQPPRRVLS